MILHTKYTQRRLNDFNVRIYRCGRRDGHRDGHRGRHRPRHMGLVGRQRGLALGVAVRRVGLSGVPTVAVA